MHGAIKNADRNTLPVLNRWLLQGSVALIAALLAGCGGDGTSNLAATPLVSRGLTVAPGSVNFPDTPSGSSSPMLVRITSSGNSAVSLRGFQVLDVNSQPSQDFAVANSCFNTAYDPGGACAIEVTFKPATQGTRNAILILDSDATQPVQTIPLSGNGTLPVRRLELNADTITF